MLENEKRLDSATLAIFWGSIFIGMTLPGAVYLAAPGRPGAHTPAELIALLFAPGINLFLAGFINGFPFLIFAVFALLHVGPAAEHGATVAHRRFIGVVVTVLILLSFSLWMNVSILTSRSSTAGLGYLFLPIYLSILIPVGYACGRLLARFMVKSDAA